MKEIYNAEDIDKAQLALAAFERDYGAKYPKVVAKIVDDADVLLEYFKYPAEHWVHLRTTNPIESTFATVRLRTKVTKGLGSRAAGMAMAYKLIEAAMSVAGGQRPAPGGVGAGQAPSSTRESSSNGPSTSPPNRRRTHQHSRLPDDSRVLLAAQIPVFSLFGEFGTWPGQWGEAHPTDLVRWDFALFWSERSALT